MDISFNQTEDPSVNGISHVLEKVGQRTSTIDSNTRICLCGNNNWSGLPVGGRSCFNYWICNCNNRQMEKIPKINCMRQLQSAVAATGALFQAPFEALFSQPVPYKEDSDEPLGWFHSLQV